MMANFSLREFKSDVMQRGLARPTRFEVQIPLPISLLDLIGQTRLINLYCDSATLPPAIIGVRPQRIYGPVYQRPFGVEYGGEGITLSFLLDQQMDIKAIFDAWIQKIVDPNSYVVEYRSNYAVDNLKIMQLNEQNEVVYTINLKDAFPRSIVPVELNYSNQNQISKLLVNFAYRSWTAEHRLLRTKEKRGTVDINSFSPETGRRLRSLPGGG
jgi:hypothetical protein